MRLKELKELDVYCTVYTCTVYERKDMVHDELLDI